MPADDSQSPTGGLLGRLADAIGARVGASSVYGAPVERDGVTVIPVAGSRFAFGGGGGSSPGEAGTDTGEGGGGAGWSRPLGYIEMRDGHTRYRRIVDPVEFGVAAFLLAASAAILARLFGSATACRRAGG
jgi:uncharacterized spore protein YtfJ